MGAGLARGRLEHQSGIHPAAYRARVPRRRLGAWCSDLGTEMAGSGLALATEQPALVSLTEELLFRGYIQGGLQRLLGHESLALFAAALLFGLAHLGAGWQWFCLASLAGIGYGLAYRRGGLMAAVLCHFGLNFVHFAGFSYPMLAIG